MLDAAPLTVSVMVLSAFRNRILSVTGYGLISFTFPNILTFLSKKKGRVQPLPVKLTGICNRGRTVEADRATEGIHIQSIPAEGNHIPDGAVAGDLLAAGNDLHGRIPVFAQGELFGNDVVLRRIPDNAPPGHLKFRRAASNFIVGEAVAAQEEILLILLVRIEGHPLNALAEFGISPFGTA